MAYIRKYRDRWRAEVQKHGQRPTQMFDTKREAQAWALAKEAELDRLQGSHGRTLQDAVDQYLKTVSKGKGLEWERRRFAAMVAHFGADACLALIDSDAIGRWRDKRLETVSGSTVNREANLLRHLFSTATDEWRWLDRNPFKGVRMPKENPPRQHVWTWQLIRRVLRQERGDLTGEMIRAFHISLHTALRLQEALGATYDARRKVLVLGKTKGTRPGQRVEVPVTRRAARALPKLMATPFKVDPNMGSTLFSKLCRQMLIEGLTFHDARATALTLLSRRMDVMTLARISRHKDLKLLLSTYYRETAEQIAARI